MLSIRSTRIHSTQKIPRQDPFLFDKGRFARGRRIDRIRRRRLGGDARQRRDARRQGRAGRIHREGLEADSQTAPGPGGIEAEAARRSNRSAFEGRRLILRIHHGRVGNRDVHRVRGRIGEIGLITLVDLSPVHIVELDLEGMRESVRADRALLHRSDHGRGLRHGGRPDLRSLGEGHGVGEGGARTHRLLVPGEVSGVRFRLDLGLEGFEQLRHLQLRGELADVARGEGITRRAGSSAGRSGELRRRHRCRAIGRRRREGERSEPENGRTHGRPDSLHEHANASPLLHGAPPVPSPHPYLST